MEDGFKPIPSHIPTIERIVYDVFVFMWKKYGVAENSIPIYPYKQLEGKSTPLELYYKIARVAALYQLHLRKKCTLIWDKLKENVPEEMGLSIRRLYSAYRDLAQFPSEKYALYFSIALWVEGSLYCRASQNPVKGSQKSFLGYQDEKEELFRFYMDWMKYFRQHVKHGMFENSIETMKVVNEFKIDDAFIKCFVDVFKEQKEPDFLSKFQFYYLKHQEALDEYKRLKATGSKEEVLQPFQISSVFTIPYTKPEGTEAFFSKIGVCAVPDISHNGTLPSDDRTVTVKTGTSAAQFPANVERSDVDIGTMSEERGIEGLITSNKDLTTPGALSGESGPESFLSSNMDARKRGYMHGKGNDSLQFDAETIHVTMGTQIRERANLPPILESIFVRNKIRPEGCGNGSLPPPTLEAYNITSETLPRESDTENFRNPGVGLVSLAVETSPTKPDTLPVEKTESLSPPNPEASSATRPEESSTENLLPPTLLGKSSSKNNHSPTMEAISVTAEALTEENSTESRPTLTLDAIPTTHKILLMESSAKSSLLTSLEATSATPETLPGESVSEGVVPEESPTKRRPETQPGESVPEDVVPEESPTKRRPETQPGESVPESVVPEEESPTKRRHETQQEGSVSESVPVKSPTKRRSETLLGGSVSESVVPEESPSKRKRFE